MAVERFRSSQHLIAFYIRVFQGYETRLNIAVAHEPAQSRLAIKAAMAMDAMTMGFAVAPEVDLQGLSAGETVHVVVQNPSMGVYIVTQLHRMGGGQPAADKGHQGHEMHQGHQMHPGMDHSGHAPAAAEPGQPEHKHGSHDHD